MLMSTRDIVLCSPVRTAIGAFNGSLKTIPATDLGATVVRETLRRARLEPAAIPQIAAAALAMICPKYG